MCDVLIDLTIDKIVLDFVELASERTSLPLVDPLLCPLEESFRFAVILVSCFRKTLLIKLAK